MTATMSLCDCAAPSSKYVEWGLGLNLFFRIEKIWQDNIQFYPWDTGISSDFLKLETAIHGSSPKIP